MSNERDRDRLTDQLLRAHGAAVRGTPEPADACLDAERLSAWVENGLSSEARSRVEEHVSSCARCQGLLAAFLETTPLVEAAAPAGLVPKPRSVVRWAGAIAACVTAAIAWTLWQGLGRAPVQMTRVEERPAPAATPFAPPPPQDADAPAEATRRDLQTPAGPAGLSRAGQTDQAKLADQLSMAARPSEAMAAANASPNAAAANARREDAAPAPAAAPPAAPPAPIDAVASASPASPGASADQSLEAAADRSRVLSEPAFRASIGQAAGSATRIVAEFAASIPGAPPTPPAPPASTSERSAGSGRGFAFGGARQASAAPTVTETAVVRWRIFSDGTVQRAAIGSTVFQPVPIDPVVPLSAGSAPSGNVCWLVGAGGVVLRSTDGTSFVRVTAPTAANLVRVTATSATLATVVAADGRQFATIDGGATWR